MSALPARRYQTVCEVQKGPGAADDDEAPVYSLIFVFTHKRGALKGAPFLISWRKAAGLSPKPSPTFNVWRSERRAASLAPIRA